MCMAGGSRFMCGASLTRRPISARSPNLERPMATIRSREISACLVLQAQSRLKALYKDNMDTIIGNCDASLFLGGKEETTLKSWNSLLGKETIDLYNTSVTKGNQESHGQNFQKLGKDLMSVDELAVMDGGKCLLQIRGVRPFLSRKYDITKHPNYKSLSDYNEKNAFDIEKFLSTRMPMRPGESYRNYEVHDRRSGTADHITLFLPVKALRSGRLLFCHPERRSFLRIRDSP